MKILFMCMDGKMQSENEMQHSRCQELRGTGIAQSLSDIFTCVSGLIKVMKLIALHHSHLYMHRSFYTPNSTFIFTLL